MSVGSFAVVAARERELNRPVTIQNLAGFGWERPLLGGGMTVFMLGFAGFPLTGGFVGKFYLFSAAYDRGWTWLVIVGVVATAVSLYYYLGVIRAMYFRPSEELQLAPVPAARRRGSCCSRARSAAAIAVTVGSFFAVAAADRGREARDRRALPLAAAELGGRGHHGLDAEDRQAGEQGRAGRRRHDAFRDRGRTRRRPDHHEGEHDRPEQGVQVLVGPVEHAAERLERRDRRRRHREQERVERERMEPGPVRRRRCDHEPHGYRPARHAQVFGARLEGSFVTLSEPVRKER
mgnify:CR=1 FL=1